MLCFVMVVSFGIWASNSKLDIVSMAMGAVAPSSQVKTVQHLEGGIVLQILVSAGDEVTSEQPLVVLEPTASGADVAELQVRLTALQADISRFDALFRGLEQPTYSRELLDSHAIIVDQSRQRFDAQTRRHESEMDKQRETVVQRDQEIAEIASRINSSRASLDLVNEQVSISSQLLIEGLTNNFKHLDLVKEKTNLVGDIETGRLSLARAKTAKKEAGAQLYAIQSVFMDDNQRALDDARRTYDELYQRIQKYEDSLARTVVRSPVDGIVKVLHLATIGGVIRPGDAIADIVPGADRLIIDAELPTQDIGYVAIGQPATIKLTSADAARFGNLYGKVIHVSPDTLENAEGQPYYKVRIETEKAYFERGLQRYNLFPGMQVMASIQTGTRTVMRYIFDPLLGNLGNAMQER
jgi:membrane fusion protein, adhesin transport system